MADEIVLQVKNLQTYFYTEEGIVPAVDGLDFELRQGETLAIVGESGCGKSVTSMSVLRLVPTPPGKILGGEILYKGEDLLKKSEKEMRSIRGNEISMIFSGAPDLSESRVYHWQTDHGYSPPSPGHEQKAGL